MGGGSFATCWLRSPPCAQAHILPSSSPPQPLPPSRMQAPIRSCPPPSISLPLMNLAIPTSRVQAQAVAEVMLTRQQLQAEVGTSGEKGGGGGTRI